MGIERNYVGNIELKNLTEAVGYNSSQATMSSETKSKILVGFYSELSSERRLSFGSHKSSGP